MTRTNDGEPRKERRCIGKYKRRNAWAEQRNLARAERREVELDGEKLSEGVISKANDGQLISTWRTHHSTKCKVGYVILASEKPARLGKQRMPSRGAVAGEKNASFDTPRSGSVSALVT